VRRWLDTAASLATDPNAGDTRADSRRSLQQVLEQRSIQEITIRPVPHQMVFDTLQFTVVASRPVELKLENQDIMPHNLVVTRPGGLEDVGEMAELMSKTDPVGAEARNYIPGFNSLVMFATPLVLPGASAALAFVAPSEPGRYPFVCTFPGHWILMNGIMNVVAEGSDVPPPQLRAASPSITSLTSSSAFREYVQDWTLEQLQPAVEESAQGRWATRAQIENGAKLFVEIGCAQCHQKNGDGGAIGPALDDVGQRFDAVETLFHILEPSESVAEEYETTMVGTRDGMFYSGLEIASDEGSITLQANPLAPEDTVVLERSDIVDRSTSPLSPMPSGLLVTLSEEEILDLLRFVRNDRLPDQP
jgi:putative heme-binding domain-containing protein